MGAAAASSSGVHPFDSILSLYSTSNQRPARAHRSTSLSFRPHQSHRIACLLPSQSNTDFSDTTHIPSAHFLNCSTVAAQQNRMHPMTSCEFAAVRHHGLLALRSGRSRPSLTLTTTTPASAISKKPAARSSARCASSRRDDADEFSCNNGRGGGRLVDEGMLVLRRRIHEMEAAERGWEPPQDWAEWEKEWYATYDADVCHLLGVIQAFLLSSRPGVGVGLVAVLALAVPASAFVLVSLLLDASRAIVSSLHH